MIDFVSKVHTSVALESPFPATIDAHIHLPSVTRASVSLLVPLTALLFPLSVLTPVKQLSITMVMGAN